MLWGITGCSSAESVYGRYCRSVDKMNEDNKDIALLEKRGFFS